MSDRLTLLRPDDWHIHLRDGAVLPHTVADVARTFGRAIIMPNLVPPVRNAEQADAYRQRILAARPAGSRFEPLMVLYLTDRTQPSEIREAKASGFVHAAKLYPPARPPTPTPASPASTRSCRPSKPWPRWACRC